MDFAFEVKCAAMRPHIVRRWGWDEAFQRDLHVKRYSEKPFFAIRKEYNQLGTLSFQICPDHVQFGEFYLFPKFLNQGVGSIVRKHCLTISDELRLPVKLEHLLWNPVNTLYCRLGFEETGHSDSHCFMERPAAE